MHNDLSGLHKHTRLIHLAVNAFVSYGAHKGAKALMMKYPRFQAFATTQPPRRMNKQEIRSG